MRMAFEYEDGTVYVTTDSSEGDCVANADCYTDKHGDIVWYSEIDEDSLFYPMDGIQ